MTNTRQREDEVADPRRIATQNDFGRELTLVKQRARLTVRQIAKAAGLPVSTVGDYFAGRHLPPYGQPEVLAKILAACGDDPERAESWVSALARARRSPGRRPSATPAPYRGLTCFQPEDADWFFGREDLTRSLIALVTEAVPAGLPLMVVGPSGSGKSSLVRAGLIPAIAESGLAGADGQRRLPILVTPGPAPQTALGAHLRGIDATRNEQLLPSAIVVDQFEEVFTACNDEDERRAFIADLSALSRAIPVVISLRADFYSNSLSYPELAAALQYRQVVVGPMTQIQLRRAIVEPARRAKIDVDEGLVELLLRELLPEGGSAEPLDAGHEAGALPLLSHALLCTWERGRGARLTVADYQASGGIRDAIARTAEAVYLALSEDGQDSARHLFLRLVRVTDEATVTRCPVTLNALTSSVSSGRPASEILGRFVDERLITVSADVAEISHEALLDAWPRLREWIDAGREGLRIRRRIDDGARVWHDAGRDATALARGGQLAIAREWAADPANRDSLNALAREYIDVGIIQEQSERDAAKRSTRRLRRLAVALTALVVATAGLTGYSLIQRQAATAARDNADSRELAIEASQVRGQDVSLAAQLSLAAYQASRTPAAIASVLESSGTVAASRISDSSGIVQAIALSPDHRTLAVVAADGTLRLWNVVNPGHPEGLGPPLAKNLHNPLYTVAFSPNGRILAAAGAGMTIRLWNITRPRRPLPMGVPLSGPASTIYSVAFSPDGHLLAAGSADDKVWLWNTASPADIRPVATISGSANYVEAVAFSPDGRTLAAGSADKTVRLWDVADYRHPAALGRPLAGPSGIVTGVTFSPDGRTLAASSQDHKVWLWNVTNPAKPDIRAPLAGAASWVNAVTFSPDGSVVAAGSSDNSIRLWSLASGRLIAVLPYPGVVTTLAWRGQHLLVSGGSDGTIRFWTLPPSTLLADGGVNSVAFNPQGTTLAVASQDLELWDPLTRARTATVLVPGTYVNVVAFNPSGTLLVTGYGDATLQLWRVNHGAAQPVGKPLPASDKDATPHSIESVAFSPDGKILASGADDGTLRLWDVRNPSHPVRLAVVHDAFRNIVYSIAYSPNGHLIAVASSDDLTRLWSVVNPAKPTRLGKPLAGPTSYAITVAFSPDGRTLAVGSADKKIRLWDISDAARPILLGKPLTGPGDYVYALAFSSDGRTLAAGITDGTVWMWNTTDPAHPTLIAELTGPIDQVFTVAFSPDDRILAAGGADGTVRLWATSASAAARAICATAGQPLSRAEWHTFDPGRPYSPPCGD